MIFNQAMMPPSVSAFPPAISINSATGVITGTNTFSAGYYASSTVSSTLALTTQGASTWTPGTTNKTISSGRYLTGNQTIKGDANLIAANIASGVSIFGINGTYMGSSATIESLSVTENGVYTAPSGVDGYSPVTVTVSGGGGFTADEIALQTISGSISGNATAIGSYAFAYWSSLTTASFPSATSIGSNAFYNCIRLTTISFPSATSIGGNAFFNCSSLTTASFPSVTSIAYSTFYNCYGLTTVSFPKVTNIAYSAFYKCSSLTTASFPSVTIIGDNAFYSCHSLTTINFPLATSIGTNAFCSCRSLTTASFPLAIRIGSSAFAYCSSLTTASFPSATSIGNSVFRACYRLISLYLTSISSVPTLGTSAFYSTPIGGYSTTAGQYGSVFVPTSLYNSFKTATNWSSISARIVSV